MGIFGKNLLLYLSILAISFAFFGVILTREMRTYLTEQRMASLIESTQRVAHSVESVFVYMYLHGEFHVEPLAAQVDNLSKILDASVVILSPNLETVFSGLSSDTNLPDMGYLEAIAEGESIIVSGRFNPASPAPILFAGQPAVLEDNIIAVVLVSISLAEFESTIHGMSRIIALSLLAAALFGAALIYISSRAMARRLRQMNDAAEIISGGVFEKRIPARSKDEVGQLATQFNNMAESLHNQEIVRHAFISNISHDIRTPLTSMLGFITAIKDGTAPPEKHDYYMDIVHDETERLIKLSNTLLDIHHIQEAKLEIVKSVFDINELIRKNILGFERRVVQKQITIASHFAKAPHMVIADEEKIQRCMYNLLDNAVKFTPNGGEIIVETTAKGKKVEISVTDNGPGMTTEEQKHIFDRFFKNDPSRNEDKMGHGLGLSIVREFISAHNEAITVESTPKKGSTFAFTLTVYENEFL